MILLRHGQSEFNVVFNRTRQDPGIPDPRLTDHGREQARLAAEALAERDLRRIVASPYTRALQTAEIIAKALDLTIEVDPLVREHALYHCDIGSPRTRLAETWPGLAFDHLDEKWWPDLDETDEQVKARARAFRSRAAGWDDWRHVAVVSHWGFILRLTGRELRNGEHIAFDPVLGGS
jgi:broad specificity phosphatase PhoE